MRIVIDINDSLIARWGSLFIHPLSYNQENDVRLYVPGFEYAAGQMQNAFQVTILPSPQSMQPPQQPQVPQIQTPRQPMLPQQPKLPQDFPPPKVPQAGYQPPQAVIPPQTNTPPPSYVPPLARPPIDPEVGNQSKSLAEASSQQPTPSNRPPLSIVTPNKEDKVSNNKDVKTKKDAPPKDGSSKEDEKPKNET